jgi:ABC-type uncharacterized transport system substrate-binding protein
MISTAGLFNRAACIGMLMLAGCVFVPLDEDSAQEEEHAVEPLAAPAALPQPTPSAAAASGAASSPAARPVPAAPPPPPQVAVLLPPEPNGFEPIAIELERQLAARGFVTLRLVTSDAAALGALAEAPRAPVCIVAIGSEAARIAIEHSSLPTVLSQVPDRAYASVGAYGVAASPPPALQLAAWKEVDPTLARVGLILSRGEYLLAAQALEAAAEAGISLELRTASSDREALYLFRRMAADVDGLWLLPDNAIMSPRVVREMLEHANARGLQSLAFTSALLDWGALISVSGTPRNVAATLTGVVERISAGEGREIPAMTALSELEIRINPGVANQLGLSPPADVWIVPGWSG